MRFPQARKLAKAKPDTKNLPYDKHDITGVWDPAPYMQPKDEVNPLALNGEPTPLPPFTPWGQQKYEDNVKFIKAGDVNDCDPFGTARNFFTPRPFEVIQAKDRMVQHYEYYDNWREIFTDGRGVPDDVDPDFMGYSTGKWDGDAFVVDSTAYNGKQFLTWTGLPLTESMHQTERWQRIDHDTLKIYFTFDDPESLHAALAHYLFLQAAAGLAARCASLHAVGTQEMGLARTQGQPAGARIRARQVGRCNFRPGIRRVYNA